MIKTVLDANVPITVGAYELVVIESTRAVLLSFDGRLAATAMRSPIAVLVRHPAGERLFDLEHFAEAPAGDQPQV